VRVKEEGDRGLSRWCGIRWRKEIGLLRKQRRKRKRMEGVGFCIRWHKTGAEVGVGEEEGGSKMKGGCSHRMCLV
jgi:hypothetical protein